MHATLAALIDRLDGRQLAKTGVIKWGAPVPSFGDLSTSRIATVGLNPSNREFLDNTGDELEGASRRFHTLRSLGIADWADTDARHMQVMLDSYRTYFSRNPYDGWFKKLDQMLARTEYSFYGSDSGACHLDLVPYATSKKWSEISGQQRSSLLSVAADTLGLLLRDSPVRVLVLNGISVVTNFEKMTGTALLRKRMPCWFLPRRDAPDVSGYSYKSIINTLSGVRLQRRILILGYNHNIQSSFGVTTAVIAAIRDWIGREAASHR